jgi:hypothetical protein
LNLAPITSEKKISACADIATDTGQVVLTPPSLPTHSIPSAIRQARNEISNANAIENQMKGQWPKRGQ